MARTTKKTVDVSTKDEETVIVESTEVEISAEEAYAKAVAEDEEMQKVEKEVAVFEEKGTVIDTEITEDEVKENLDAIKEVEEIMTEVQDLNPEKVLTDDFAKVDFEEKITNSTEKIDELSKKIDKKVDELSKMIRNNRSSYWNGTTDGWYY